MKFALIETSFAFPHWGRQLAAGESDEVSRLAREVPYQSLLYRSRV